MKVSYNWLQEFVEEKLPDPKELGHILTMGAYEYEGADELNGDFILDFDVQPNRAHDSFCHYGIAKEIGVQTGSSIKSYQAAQDRTDFSTDTKVEINDSRCYRYSTREIRGVVVGESSPEIKHKLATMGQRSINNVVDLTNIVMFEMGQPTHIFDKDKLSGNTIFVRKATQDEQLLTLDDKEVIFKKEEMVIADEEKSLAVAGVKGGKATGVTEKTVNLLLEAANFDATAVRFARRDNKIETDSSKRFERGITAEFVPVAMERLTDLILEHCSDEETQVSDVIDVYPRPIPHFKTGVSVCEVNQHLGTELNEAELDTIFDRLGFEYEKVDGREKFMETAQSCKGNPYVFGASVLFDAPDGFDCSSFVSYCAKESGVSIPRMTIDQYVWTREISKDDLRPGDVIFSNQHVTSESNQSKFTDKPELQAMIAPEHQTSKEFVPGTKIERPIDHVGIYMDEGKIMHCTGDTGVIIEDLESSKSFEDIVSYRRIFDCDEKRHVITIPHERLDIRTAVNVMEEIARVYGLTNIESKPVERVTERVLDKERYYAYKISKFLVDRGFSEIMTYVLRDTGNVELSNPLASDKRFMRDSLLPGLTESLTLNMHNIDLLGLDAIKVFEFGTVFNGDKEDGMLSIGFEIANTKRSKSEAALQSLLKDLENELGVSLNVKIEDQTKVEINLTKLLEKLSEPEGYYDLDLELPKGPYRPFSKYPFMLRDIAVWTPEGTEKDELLQIITDEAGELLGKTKLFDEFTKDGRTSYAYRLVFQSHEKTLSDEEINVIMDRITQILNEKEGFKVR